MIAALRHFHFEHPVRLLVYLALALLTSGMKVVVPGLNGTMSVTFLFVLLGTLELSLAETMVVGCAATLTQCFWKMNRPARPVRVLFNVVSMMAPTVYATYRGYHVSGQIVGQNQPLMVMAAVCIFFLANTLPIATVISLAERRPFWPLWRQYYFWTLPLYLAGAGLVAMIHLVNNAAGWKTTLLIIPVVYWIYRSYCLYTGKLEKEKQHAEEVSQMHLRTVEALALAIDAKDHITHDHLRRVRVYAVEIAREMKLPPEEIEAIRAAAMLHDIGKLAVPEHIINKPGKLTPEEVETMRIHPVVGAEILSRVKFPYPVVPIVRSHHEKWDGTGHPDGLKGEQIPIGSRILAAVDCLDALASDRQYRSALPLDEAMQYVASLAGKEFDPKVVEILQRRYRELERLARSENAALPEEAGVWSKGAPPRPGSAVERPWSAKKRLQEEGTDPLTGLPGPFSLSLHLEREIIRCQRTNTSLAVLMCELSGMSTVEGSLGPHCSSRALCVFAQKVKEICREYDYLAHMGRNEFAIVIPGLTPEAAVDKALRIADCAADAGRYMSQPDLVSAATGTAFYAKDGVEAEQLLSVAGARMRLSQQHRQRTKRPAFEASSSRLKAAVGH